MADDDLAHVADVDGCSTDSRHRDFFNVGYIVDQAQPAHNVEFGPVLHVGTAGIGVAVGQRGEDLG